MIVVEISEQFENPHLSGISCGGRALSATRSQKQTWNRQRGKHQDYKSDWGHRWQDALQQKGQENAMPFCPMQFAKACTRTSLEEICEYRLVRTLVDAATNAMAHVEQNDRSSPVAILLVKWCDERA